MGGRRSDRQIVAALIAASLLTATALVLGSVVRITWPGAFLAVAMVCFGCLLVIRLDRRRARAAQTDLVDLLGARVIAAEAAHERQEEILHELKATVGGVAMASRLLSERRGEMGQDTVTRLEDMRQAELGRLQRLLGHPTESPAGPVDLHETISPLVVSLTSRGHAVEWRGTALRALALQDDVAEVVHIMLENAARHAPGSDIRIRVEDRDEQVAVVVSDTGDGVPLEARGRIFERGYRAEQSPGHGIGLHAGRRIALQLGGDLRLETSRERRGASFALTLPAERMDALCHAHSA
ncbi:sensor histidine kinase [Nocardioides sp.]|uniref:sensor histidine kinase n=1 Tax=Nocardioides sp. TaxID=35761 RepID=UPI00286D279F|nr:sensor histidine kinase [Nocardioides sp.]